MKAEELRIGNIVDTAVGVIQIEEIPLKSNPLYNPNALHPIVLSEEWFLKFGFKSIKSITGYEISVKDHLNLEVSTISNDFWNCSLVLKTEDEGLWFGAINYVHQLQNLYFTLTGTELKLNQNEKP